MSKISFYILILFLILGVNFNGWSQREINANDCKSLFALASVNYESGRFGEALEGLEILGRTSCPYADAGKALRLEALCYIASRDIDLAEEAIRSLLRHEPDYARSDDSMYFKKLIGKVQDELYRESTSSISKISEDIASAPATILVIDEQQIKDRGYTDLELLFHDLPGFSISRSMGLAYSNLFQRGHRSASNTDRTLILVDGVEDNDLWTNRVSLSRQYSMSNIKRVEVIHGPASTMYGANAFLGVINIVTKNGHDLFRGSKQKFASDIRLHYSPFEESNGKYWKNAQRCIDGTIGFRFGENNQASFIVNGRMYVGEDMNRSDVAVVDPNGNTQRYWDYTGVPNANADYTSILTDMMSGVDDLDQYELYALPTISEGDTVYIPTAAAISLIDSLDQVGAQNTYNLRSYSNPVNNYSTSAKLQLKGFTAGMQHWRRSEGAGASYTDYTWGSSAIGTNWTISQTNLYVKYEKYIKNFYLQSFTRYKVHGVTPVTNLTKYYDYSTGRMSWSRLMAEETPYWKAFYFNQQSKQLRSELRLGYTGNYINAIGGIEYRNSAMQGDYRKAKTNEIRTLDELLTESARDDLDPLYDAYTNVPTIFDVFDLGFYSQATLKNRIVDPNLMVTIGLRYDENKIDKEYNYHVWNPRFALVFKHKKNTFKGIYSTAFKDASYFNRYATSGSRVAGLSGGNTLTPERSKNIEFSIARNELDGRLRIYLCYYRTKFENPIELFPNQEAGKNQFRNDAASFFIVNGGHLDATYVHNEKFSSYFNFTFTNSQVNTDTTGVENAQLFSQNGRHAMGDIPNISFNLGSTYSYNEDITMYLGVNHVGDRRTGQGTRIASNPFELIEAYTLLNANVSWTLWKGDETDMGVSPRSLTVQLNVHNLLNKEYYHPGVRTADENLYAPILPQPGRRMSLRLLLSI